MNKKIKILISIGIVIVALILSKDFIIKTLVESQASRILGAQVHIQSLSLSFFKQSVRIKGLHVENPVGFEQGILVDIPEIGLDLDVPQLVQRKLHFPLVILNLKELNIIRNKEGKLNVDGLKVSQPKNNETVKDPTAQTNSQGEFQIDVLKLTLGKVNVKENPNNPRSVRVININIQDKTYKNIQSAQYLSVLVLVEAMKPAAIRDAAIYSAQTLVNTAVHIPTKIVNTIFDKIEGVLK